MNLTTPIKIALCCASISVAPTLTAEQEHPNIVLIFADDLGYGDLGCYGATKVQTPNIDKLAAEGRRFIDAHSASAVCTPSRYGLMTGEYPMRAGLWGPCSPTSKLLIDTEKLTIADVLKNEGYETSVFGKWHLGFGETKADYSKSLRPGPQDLGFDYYFGVPVVNSAPPYVYVENDKVYGMTPDDPIFYTRENAEKKTPITPLERKHGSRVSNWFGGAVEAHKLYNDFTIGTTLAEKATDWIKERDGSNPFFLYFAATNIHHPFTPAPRFQGTSQAGIYGDFIHELDWIVGEVVKTLEEKGVAENTLIIFTSDNGGMFNRGGQDAFEHGHKQNGELLGFKFGVWEGGHRVPFIAKWPGEIEAGTTTSQVISGVDFLATFAALTKQDIPKEKLADSVDVLPAFIGDPKTPVREELILSPRYNKNLSLRQGKWMYIPAKGAGGFTGDKRGHHTFSGPAAASFIGSVNSDIVEGKISKDAPAAQLYNLEEDMKQTKNVIAEHPEVAKQMAEKLNSYLIQMRSNSKKKK